MHKFREMVSNYSLHRIKGKFFNRLPPKRKGVVAKSLDSGARLPAFTRQRHQEEPLALGQVTESPWLGFLSYTTEKHTVPPLHDGDEGQMRSYG